MTKGRNWGESVGLKVICKRLGGGPGSHELWDLTEKHPTRKKERSGRGDPEKERKNFLVWENRLPVGRRPVWRKGSPP